MGSKLASLRTKFTRKRVIGAASIAAVAAIALSAAPTTAYFTGSQKVQDVTVGAATLDVAFPNGSDLQFKNLQPNVQQDVQFTVTNTGSISGDGKIGQPLDPKDSTANAAFANVNSANYGQLLERIQGNGVDSGWVASNGQATLPLGFFQAGASKTFTVSFMLDKNAGDEWQGVQISSRPTVTLEQHDGR